MSSHGHRHIQGGVLNLHEDKEPGEWVGDRIHQIRIEAMRADGSLAEVVAETLPHLSTVDALNRMREIDDL